MKYVAANIGRDERAHSPKLSKQSIRLTLGRYARSPALLLMEIPLIAKATTTVQWAFAENAQLIEGFVDNDTELGDYGAAEWSTARRC